MRPARDGRLRLLQSVRGEGPLMSARRAARPVAYCIDIYAQGKFRSGDGDVSGDFRDLVGRSPADVRLRLANGLELRVALRGVTKDSASIELLAPAPATLV